jgi:copper homeostasis protein
MSILIEIAVDTFRDAVAAQEGGAHRIELCSDLGSDGLSPSVELLREVRRAVTIPIHAMVRPRAGDFCYSEVEFQQMQREVELFCTLGADGIVSGILHPDRTIDIERTKQLVRTAQPVPVTFHRAFDAAVEPMNSLEQIIQTGAARLLTSGQRPSAPEGIPLISSLIRAAHGKIIVMPGAGIDRQTIGSIAAVEGVRELHIGKGVKKIQGDGSFSVDRNLTEELVRSMQTPMDKKNPAS